MCPNYLDSPNGPENEEPELLNDPAGQQQKLELEIKHLSLEEKLIAQNISFAEKSLNLNAELIRKAPKEHRLNVLVYGAIVFAFVLVIAGIIFYGLVANKDKFVEQSLNTMSHIFGLAFGYWAGRKTSPTKKSPDNTDPIQDTEIIR